MVAETVTRRVTSRHGERLEVQITLDVQALEDGLCSKAAASAGGRATLRDGLIRATAREINIDFDGIARGWGHPGAGKRRIAGGRITVRARQLV